MPTTLEILASSIRGLRRNPGFAITAMLTLAIGIAPNCMIFSIIYATYFHPLPYPAQENLALVNLAR